MRKEIEFDIETTDNWCVAIKNEQYSVTTLALTVIFRILNLMLKRELKRLA